MGKKIISRKEHWANLIIGIIITLAGLAGLVFFISLPSPLSEKKIMSSEETQDLLDGGVPEEVILAYNKGNKERFILGSDTAPIISEAEWRIYFEEQNSLGGLWRGEKAIMRINDFKDSVKCLPDNEFAGYSKKKKWMSIHTHQYSKIRPYMNVKVSAPDQKYIHSWIKARASMDLIFPFLYSSGFKNNNKTLERNLTFFVISEKEDALLRELMPPYRIILPVRIISLAFSGLFVFLGIWLLVEFANDKKKRIIL